MQLVVLPSVKSAHSCAVISRGSGVLTRIYKLPLKRLQLNIGSTLLLSRSQTPHTQSQQADSRKEEEEEEEGSFSRG